jgi:hypothetical protein
MDPSSLTPLISGLPASIGGATVAAKVWADFLKRVFGPVGDEAGRTLAHPLQAWNE